MTYSKKTARRCILICLFVLLFALQLKADVQAKNKISLSKNKLALYENEKYKLKAKKGKVKWSSSNRKVATISAKGVVRARKYGSVKIYAKRKQGGKNVKAVCRVQVGQYVKSLQLKSANSVILKEKACSQIQILVSPQKALEKTCEYRSLNPTIATVSSTGNIIAKSPGLTQICVTTKGMNKKKKRLTKNIYVFVERTVIDNTDITPVPTSQPTLPNPSSPVEIIIPAQTSAPPSSSPTSIVPDETEEPVADPTVTPPTIEPTGEPPILTPSSAPEITGTPKPVTLQEAIDCLPAVDSNTLLAGTILVKEGSDSSTLYFINPNYSGSITLVLKEKVFSTNETVRSFLSELQYSLVFGIKNSTQTIYIKKNKGEEWCTLQDLIEGETYVFRGYLNDTVYKNKGGYGLIIVKGDTRDVFKLQ